MPQATCAGVKCQERKQHAHGNNSRPAKGRGDRAEIYRLRLRRRICNHVLFNSSAAWERERWEWKQETNLSPLGLGHEHV